MLTINHKDFIEGFSAIADFFDRPPHVESSLTCSNGKLLVRTEGMEIEIPVQGHYDGVIWLSGEATYGLAHVAKHHPPKDAQVTICDGILRVGRMTLPVRYEDSEPPNSIFVPKDAPLHFWLTLEYKHTLEELEAAGLTEILEGVREKMDSIIEEATALLAPFRVKESALREFIKQSLARPFSAPGTP